MINCVDIINEVISFMTNEFHYHKNKKFQFKIVNEGIFPEFRKSEKVIYVPRNIVPFIMLTIWKYKSPFVQYDLIHNLIESDFYDEAETLIDDLDDWLKGDSKLEYTYKYHCILKSVLLYIICHEIGHLLFLEDEAFKMKYLSPVEEWLDEIIEQEKNETEKKKKETKDALENSYAKILTTTEFMPFDKLVDDLSAFTNSEKFRKVLKKGYKLEELAADDFALNFICNNKNIFSKLINDWQWLPSYCCYFIQHLSHISLLKNIMYNECTVGERMDEGYKSLEEIGFASNVFDNIRVMSFICLADSFSDSGVLEKVDYNELWKDFYDASAVIGTEIYATQRHNLELLYEGNTIVADNKRKSNLYKKIDKINDKICYTFDISFTR